MYNNISFFLSYKRVAFLYSKHTKFTKKVINVFVVCVWIQLDWLLILKCVHIVKYKLFSFKLLTIRDKILISVIPLLFSIIYVTISWNFFRARIMFFAFHQLLSIKGKKSNWREKNSQWVIRAYSIYLEACKSGL